MNELFKKGDRVIQTVNKGGVKALVKDRKGVIVWSTSQVSEVRFRYKSGRLKPKGEIAYNKNLRREK